MRSEAGNFAALGLTHSRTSQNNVNAATTAAPAPTIVEHPTPPPPPTEAVSSEVVQDEKRWWAPTKPNYAGRKPWGMGWRSSSWYITAVVTVGVFSDLLAYTIVVPVLPFRLQVLGYDHVAQLTSYLLIAYSGGVFIATFPVAWFFHRHPYRRGPLVAAVLVLEGSFVLFMVPKPYWCMVIARVLQGMTSCVVWTVGFALICENIDPKNLGTALGFAFSGVTVGVTIAPPIGGALYEHLGWHAPFIFCIIVCALDLAARVLVIEQKDVRKYDAAAAAANATMVRAAAARGHSATAETIAESTTERTVINESGDEDKDVPVAAESDTAAATHAADLAATEAAAAAEADNKSIVELSPWGVLIALASLPRGMVGFGLVGVFGFIIGGLDAALPLHIQATWNKSADDVGIIFLIAACPAFFIGPIAGHLADKWGTEWVLLPSLIFSLPWMPLMILRKSLPAFVVFFACTNLVATLLNVAASLEMAIVSKFKEGISEIHEFAALNIAFSVFSAIGAIVGGQVYDRLSNGWDVLCWIGFAVFVVACFPPLFWTGAWPVFYRMQGKPGPASCRPPEGSEAEKIDPEAGIARAATREHELRAITSATVPNLPAVEEVATPRTATPEAAQRA